MSVFDNIIVVGRIKGGVAEGDIEYSADYKMLDNMGGEDLRTIERCLEEILEKVDLRLERLIEKMKGK